jgi:hypothetical protein
MIGVEPWSVIASTAGGIHSQYLQRELFEGGEEMYVVRLRAGRDTQSFDWIRGASPHLIAKLVHSPRSLC